MLGRLWLLLALPQDSRPGLWAEKVKHSRAELGFLDVVLLGECVGACGEPGMSKCLNPSHKKWPRHGGGGWRDL